MFKTSTFAYWCCQAAGWGLVWGAIKLNSYFGYIDMQKVLITIGSGLLATHLTRTFIRRHLPPAPSLRKESLRMLLAVLCATGLVTALRCLGLYFFTEYHGILTSFKVFAIMIDSLMLIIPWMLIYWFYRLVVYNRIQSLERRRLEWRLKQMQTHASGSEVTMEDLMEEVDRIVELIDENPIDARSEITAFSRLLREGYLV